MWTEMEPGTYAMVVPTGLIIKSCDQQESGNGIAVSESMVFIPCTPAEATAWITRGASEF